MTEPSSAWLQQTIEDAEQLAATRDLMEALR